MHRSYLNPAIRKLRDEQVRIAAPHTKLQQVDRAERLLAEIDPNQTYTYEFLYDRVANARPESTPNLKLTGEEAAHDLRLLVEDLSDAAALPAADAGERVLTVDDLSRQFHVSPKTISRWRRKGLVSRRFLFDGRKRVGFLKSSVDRFIAANEERVKRGARFSQLDDEERHEIVEGARRMANVGSCASEVTRRLAERMGRSAETIRYTLRQFDRRNPDRAIFPNGTGPLSPEARERIYQMYRGGTPVTELAKRFCRTKTSIYRVINEKRVEHISKLPLDFIDSDEFRRPGAQRRILGAMPGDDEAQRTPRRPAGLPPYLASLYEVPLLTREREAYLFRKMNYLKYRASRLRDRLDSGPAKSALLDQIEDFFDQAVATKNHLVRANLRLVVSIAKRHVAASDNFFELVSDGNMSLLRAIEKFDYSRGNKFSTYGSWAIMKNFARTIPDALKRKDRFRTSHDEMFAATEDDRSDLYEIEAAQRVREDHVGRIMDSLDEREQRIIVSRFGLERGTEPQTLKEVGAQLGVTKERIRQIEARALNKLRKAAQDKKIELPE